MNPWQTHTHTPAYTRVCVCVCYWIAFMLWARATMLSTGASSRRWGGVILPRQFSKVFPRRPKKLATFCNTYNTMTSSTLAYPSPLPPPLLTFLHLPCTLLPVLPLHASSSQRLLKLVNSGLISVAVPDHEAEIVHESYAQLPLLLLLTPLASSAFFPACPTLNTATRI